MAAKKNQKQETNKEKDTPVQPLSQASKLHIEKADTRAADLLAKEAEEEMQGNESKEEHSSISSAFYIAMGLLILIFVGIFFIPRMMDTGPKTLDETHAENLKRGYDREDQYVLNGYSFVFYDGLWYTQIQNKQSTKLYNVPLHYGPKDVLNITLMGDFEPFFTKALNNSIGNYSFQTYLTFDPVSDQLPYVALATAELTQNMATIFNLAFIPACTKNETGACQKVPIITCDATQDPVIYMSVEEGPVLVQANGTCVIIQGKREDLVRAVDRFLYAMYNIL